MMKCTLCLCCVALVLSVSPSRAQTADSSLKTATARQLLEMSGGGTLGARVVEQMTSSFKQRLPNVPAAFWDEIQKEINADELIMHAIPVYTKHFTVKEMRDIMAFYKTPSGAKLVEAMPDITQDMVRVGQEWGKEIGQKVMLRLQEKGYLKQQEKK